VHPTQLYESLVGFALVPLGLWLVRKRKFTGQAFLIIIPCYAFARFMLEFIRGDSDRGGFGNHAAPTLSTSQFIGLLLIPLVIALYLYRRKKAPVPPVPLSKEEVEKNLIEAGVVKKKDKGSAVAAPSKKSAKSRSSRKKK
jgi:prolipoprotein diacylglyceryltransferase